VARDVPFKHDNLPRNSAVPFVRALITGEDDMPDDATQLAQTKMLSSLTKTDNAAVATVKLGSVMVGTCRRIVDRDR